MKKNYYPCVLFIFLCFSNISFAQINPSNSTTIDAKVETTYAEFLGTTPPIKELISLQATDQQKRKKARKNWKAPKDFPGRSRNTVIHPALEHQGPDPIRQTSFSPESMISIEPLVNILGLSSGTAPNDPSGDIGKNYYVQAVNATTIGVYDKQGNLLNTFTGNTLWSSIGFSSAGDPIIMYDQEAERWIITEFPQGNQLLVAISKGTDPMGEYDVYNFATPSFPDYPKYGIWKDSYTVTTNEGSAGILHCYLIDRNAMLTGETDVPIQRIELPGSNDTEAGFFVATPVDWTGLTAPTTGPLFMVLNDSSWGDVAEDQVEIYTIDVDFANADNTTIVNLGVPLTPFDSYPCSENGPGFACVPQSGGNGLDAIPEVIMHQAHYRNFDTHEAMVFNFITDATDGDNLSGIRWVELRRTGGDWFLYQEGTFAPDDGKDRFMAGICIDKDGNIGLAYNVTSNNTFVGVNFTGRRSSDPLGEMTVEEYVAIEGDRSISSFGRFGDYAHMSVDPTNGRVFWYTTEYAGGEGGGDVDTRIIAFELSRDTIDIGPSLIASPQSTPDLTDSEMVSIEVTNFGLETQEEFEVGYIFENGSAVVESVNYTLEPNAVYAHTFATPVNMSAIGDYKFKVFTNLADDQAPLNDTIRATISRQPRFDVGISNIDGLDGSFCEDEAQITFTLNNFGSETISSATIEISINGNIFQSFDWNGTLAPGASFNFPFTISGFIDGNNSITISASNPNGMTDEVMANNASGRTFNIIENAAIVTLSILADRFPNETSWGLYDLMGNEIATGGPYPENLQFTTITEEFCLDPDLCYNFIMEDSYGDGICCIYGEGDFTITNADGGVLLDGDGNFGYISTNQFCATFMCMLGADFDIAATSTVGVSDGTILVSPINGFAPFQFSIDGGETFQSSPVFNDLAAGEYTIFIQDNLDCTYEETVILQSCTLDYSVEIENASNSNANDGTIVINVANGIPPYQYSTSAGSAFQASNVFQNLNPGDYSVVVRDALGCVSTQSVVVDFNTDTKNVLNQLSIKLAPNPTKGIFRIDVKGWNKNSVFLNIEVYDVNGKRIQESSIVRYDETYTGQVSLIHYPSGIYFVRFVDKDINRLIKVIKE